MTLRERRGDSETVYNDEKLFTETEWTRLLGIPTSSIQIVTHGSLDNKVEFRHGKVRLTPISSFPRMVAQLAKMRTHRVQAAHPWADVNTEGDFQVIAPSGATFIYEHPRGNTIFSRMNRAVRRLRRG